MKNSNLWKIRDNTQERQNKQKARRGQTISGVNPTLEKRKIT
jgi:hypothetical protein